MIEPLPTMEMTQHQVELNAEVRQFLSRANLPLMRVGTRTSSPRQRPDIHCRIEFDICSVPLGVHDAEINPSSREASFGRRPSMGAAEWHVEDAPGDAYLADRWPRCMRGTATVSVPAVDANDDKILKSILSFLRLNLWTLTDEPSDFPDLSDQLSTTTGYRRQYFNTQMFDISGVRRPSSSEHFERVTIGDYVGPGFACIDNRSFPRINEFVWSQVIPFPSPTDVDTDRPMILAKVAEMRKHFNSYSELKDARRHHAAGDLKAGVRAAASAVDAVLRYYCRMWDVPFPDRGTFDQKMEGILASAGKPSYRSVDQSGLENILYLYRARSSMHEGDNYYKDNQGNIIDIGPQNLERFIGSAKAFTFWIDSVA